ncbi:MAG: hypothetical protein JNM29_13475 [Candidatus Odyssella sp.]|nr:hypothetical protein [Candidatus Odyssella sp.]
MIERYPYFVAALLLLATIPVYLAAAGTQRRAAAWSGLLFAPLALGAPLLGTDYWAARRLGGMPLGLEDAIYFGQLGVASWFFASLPLRHRLHLDLRPGALAVRALVLVSALIAGLAVGVAAGVSAIEWAFVTWGALIAGVLAWRSALWPLALSAALLHGAALAITMAILLAMWPELGRLWSQSHPLGRRVLGIPFGEILWGTVAPAAIALAFGFASRAQLSSARPRRRARR